MMICATCKGEGTVDSKKCPECKGERYVSDPEAVAIAEATRVSLAETIAELKRIAGNLNALLTFLAGAHGRVVTSHADGCLKVGEHRQTKPVLQERRRREKPEK